jgi:hypothetical protein
MQKTLLFALVSMVLALSAAAQAPLLKLDRRSFESPVQSVACVGDRRTYRSFTHCWRVNRKLTPRVASAHCSRICPGR